MWTVWYVMCVYYMHYPKYFLNIHWVINASKLFIVIEYLIFLDLWYIKKQVRNHFFIKVTNNHIYLISAVIVVNNNWTNLRKQSMAESILQERKKSETLKQHAKVIFMLTSIYQIKKLMFLDARQKIEHWRRWFGETGWWSFWYAWYGWKWNNWKGWYWVRRPQVAYFIHVNTINLCRILLNLSGIEDIDNIGLESSELMRKIDADGSGMIDRLEWREKWQSMQKHLGKV